MHSIYFPALFCFMSRGTQLLQKYFHSIFKIFYLAQIYPSPKQRIVRKFISIHKQQRTIFKLVQLFVMVFNQFTVTIPYDFDQIPINSSNATCLLHSYPI